MIDRIEIMDGDSGWPHAAPLLAGIWPAEVVATLPWRDVVWAKPDRRLLGFNRHDEIVGHAAIFLRNATWDDRSVSIGGIGGVATREDSRRRGVASTLVSRFRSSQGLAAPPDANFGIKGTLANICF